MSGSSSRLHRHKWVQREGRINRNISWCKREIDDSNSEIPPPESELLFSWRELRPDIIPPPYEQDDDKCWTVALFREHYCLMKMIGQTSNLSPDIIFNGVDIKHRMAPGGAIDDTSNIISFFKDYVKVSIFYRPKLDDEEGLQRFEDLIEEKMKIFPVVVGIDVLPSYKEWDGSGLYIPDDDDRAVRSYEKFVRHLMLLTGHGIESGVRFWQTLDNFGEDFGDDMGFIKFSRDIGLVRELIVFEVLD